MPYFGDRLELLKRSLYMLDHQTIKDNFEVLLLNDGGDINVNQFFSGLSLNKMTLRYIPIRTRSDAKWRTPGYALKKGYAECNGDFVIVTSPEIIVPYNALEIMMEGDTTTLNVPALYKLSKAQQAYIDQIDWKHRLDNLTGMNGFWTEETAPGGWFNQEAKHNYHHGGFVGATRAVWDQIGIVPPDPESTETDSYWHKRLMELNQPVHRLDLEVYHQWHPRKDAPEQSVRIRRLNELGR